MSWQAALIGAAGQVASNVINAQNASNLNAENRDWQYRMWLMQNEYNLPKNQVQRLKEAGINPNLAFGSQASTMSANFGQPSSTYLPRYESVTSAALQALQVEASIRRQNADSDSQEMQNDVIRELLDLVKENKRSSLQSEIVKNNWWTRNAEVKYDLELKGEELMNDLRKADKAYKVALTSKTNKDIDIATREYQHLISKYGFEDHFYNRNLNPYEPGKVLGFVRSSAAAGAGLFRIGQKSVNWLGNKLGELNHSVKIRHARNRNIRLDRSDSYGLQYRGLTR